jgi:hypothetical protein
MEMPEGWIILNSDVKELRADGHITDAEYVYELLQLSKEMAEALDASHALLNRYSDICNQNSEVIVTNFEILKKFETWK